MYGWENAGLMSPWANAWGMQPQTIADTVVREQVAPALGVEGTSSGYATPGNPNAATQTSQTTKDRVRDSLTGSLGTMAGKAAIGTAAALGAGMPTGMIGNAVLGGVMSPSAIGGPLGNVTNATLGTQPEGFISKAIANFAVPAAAGFIGGPIGGLLGGLVGGPVADAIADGLDMRSNEDVRDSLEDNKGYFGGRTAFADMKSVMDKVNKAQAAMQSGLSKVNSVRGIAGISPASYGGTSMSMDTISPRGYGMGGTGTSNTSRGWGGYDPGYASTGFGISNRADEIARAALDGVNWGGFNVGRGGSGGRDSGGFGANDGNSDTAGNAGYGR